MWFRRGRGRHRKDPGTELETRLEKVTEQHERESWKVAAKATRLSTAADRLIATNAQKLDESAQRS